MPQRKSGCKLEQAWPAFLVIAKSADAEKAGATQHSAKQFLQSARRLERSPSGTGSTCSCSRFSDNVGGLPGGSYASRKQPSTTTLQRLNGSIPDALRNSQVMLSTHNFLKACKQCF